MALPEVRQIEVAGLSAWPGMEIEHDGAWVRRAAGGYTHRANSVQCLDPADHVNAPDRLAATRRWFEARGLEPVFRVTPLAGPDLREALREIGWQATRHSHVLAKGLDEGHFDPDPRVAVLATDDPEWLSAQGALQDYDAATLERLEAIVKAIKVPARGLLLRSGDGDPVASALVDAADGIAFAGNVVTAASERGKGYGTAVMRSALAWGVAAGARAAALSVLTDNAAALALYRSLGYVEMYDYHYCKPLR